MNYDVKKIFVLTVLVAALSACERKPEDSPSSSEAHAQPDAAAPLPAAASAEGSVQRDYPSADEEAALGLDYPIFKRYSPDMVRLTPFFPGKIDRPVSVKLTPSDGGYILRMESSGCAFPLAYELRAGDGKQLATGEYKGADTVDIPNWDGQLGTALLAVKMADGAENNYGCNLVVAKD